VSGAATGSRTRALRATGRGFNKIFGFGLSMLLLAIASLVAIPSMVASSGPRAWGMIAAGQAVGAVAAVAVAYGWGMSGPAKIAKSDLKGRLSEYAESVVCELLIFLPVGLVAFGIAWLIGHDYGLYAGVGALSTASVGLTANWYFIGMARPYALLVGETLPRVAGTLVGILYMVTGSSALIGVLWQLIGMLAAFVICTVWILQPWSVARRRMVHRRPIKTVLWTQRHGLTATLVSAVYSAAPITIVTVVAPVVQPVYAVLDKVQRQVNAGLSPFTVVMQGWIPRAARGGLATRIKQAMLLSVVFGLALAAFMLLIAQDLMRWLGGGRIQPGFVALVLMSAITGVYLFENVVAKAALPALAELGVAAKASIVGMAVGLPLVAVGAVLLGAEGALAGILVGIVVRLLIELFAVRSARDADATISEQSAPEGVAELGMDAA
jgi:hypothetical protein